MYNDLTFTVEIMLANCYGTVSILGHRVLQQSTPVPDDAIRLGIFNHPKMSGWRCYCPSAAGQNVVAGPGMCVICGRFPFPVDADGTRLR